MSKFSNHAAYAIAICAATLLAAGIVMSIMGDSSSGTFTTRTGAVSGGTITSAGVIALAALLGGMLLALFGKNKPKKKK